jgi:hypothetical protein
VRLDPVSAGDACTSCTSFISDGVVVVGADHRGLFKFAAPLPAGGVGQAWLSLNRIWASGGGHEISVYGVGSSSEGLLIAELGAGRLLGTLQMPGSIYIGEEILLDVTGFVQGTPASYLAFSLTGSDGYDVFSSVETAYGLPSHLILAQVPEPGPGALMFAGLLTMAGWLRRRASA